MINQTKPRHPIIRMIASLKLTLVILGVFAVAIAVATFIEVRYGMQGARALVYDALWFEALLALLIVNLVASLFANMPYRKFQTGFVITHIAFILVLVSSAITRYFGYEGRMHIREGSSTGHLMSDRDFVELRADGQSDSFPVRLYRAGETGVHKTLVVAGKEYDVSVDEYWPRFEMVIEDGQDGRPLVGYTSHDGHRGLLDVGDTFQDQGITLHFVDDPGEVIEAAGSPFGELVVTISGATTRHPVPQTPPASFEAGRISFTVTEFMPNFRVGSTPSPDDPMANPAVRVQVADDAGNSEERLLFAFHPDFNMGERSDALTGVEITYVFGGNIYVFFDASGLAAISDVAMDVVAPNSQGATSVSALESTSLAPGSGLRAGAFHFTIQNAWRSAVEKPGLSDNPDHAPAIRVRVSDAEGNQDEAIVTKWSDGATVDIAGTQLVAGFGPVRIDLPYRLELEDFVLQTYPGSSNPASFESHVKIYDDERGISGEPYHIYMNHPLTYRGFKHFQSSYDQDRRGTILSVNHDPGKWPTYVAYFFVGLGFLITLTRGLVWNRKPNV